MGSQRLGSLSQTSDGCFSVDERNFQALLPRLKDFLRETDRRVQLTAIRTLLGPCMAICSPNLLGETILDDATPVARRLFFETVDEVDGLVASATFDVLDDVREKLECCEDLMECWTQCLVQLCKLGKLPALQVRAVLENVVDVIKRSFEHCKTSEEAYGVFFEKVNERLTTLFRKTNEVQKLFCHILERAIVFDNDAKSELSALAKAVSVSGDICLLIDGLDTKSMVECWKGFTKIAVIYCKDLKTFSPPCVAPHLASLADVVSSSVRTIVEEADQGYVERSIRLHKLLLKILHKLCGYYSGYLGNVAASAVLRLLVQLHRYSRSCLKMLDIQLEIVDSIEANFTSSIDQLLDTVITDSELKQALFTYQSNGTADDIGYYFLTVNVVNKLIASSSESERLWRKSPHDILEVAFTNVNLLQEELFAGELYLGNLPLYDATLIAICGLVASTRDEDFASLEILLLKNLLGGNLWCSLMAADVWCFVEKYASSDLCYNHLTYLLSVYEHLKNRNTSLEAVMLENLIFRLYVQSPCETKNRLIDKFETNKARFWKPLRRCISQSDKMFLYELTSLEVESIATTWETLHKQPSVANWSRLVNQLAIVGTFGQYQNEEIVRTLIEIWNFLGKSMDEFHGIHLHIITQLTAVLFEATLILQDRDKDHCAILSTLTSLVPQIAPCLRVRVSNYLKESTENFEKSGSKTEEALSNLYCSLLEDSNPRSREEALESLAHVTSASRKELALGIIDAVAGVPKVRDSVSFYLSRTPLDNLRGFTSPESFLRQLFQVYRRSTAGNHACTDHGESHREEKRRKLEAAPRTRPGTPEDIRYRIDRLSDDIDHILSRKQDLTEFSLNRLGVIANKIISSSHHEG
ncbi:FIGNL1-interacting regulator of recombination and mitosis [Neodiprion pinetum]|uniref:FIGNL1-interacting regulator of recombination and mitosis n=1 Tax=Neodiprion pinetum TaxID=441929 RepID=UPI001EDEEF9B|nr:uncharacterized protein C1orf112 homolog isoform X1 [Neodiprion pinetum]